MALIKQYYLKNGKKRYEVSCYIGTNGSGKEKRIHKRGFIKESDAKRFAKNTEADILNNKINTSFKSSMTLRDYLTEWLNKYKVNVKEGSMIIYRYNVNHYLIPRIGHYQISKYTYDVHQEFINSLFESGGKDGRPLSKNTVSIINSTLNNALSKAVKLGFIHENPTSHVEFPKKYDSEEPKLHYWTVAESDLFLEFAKKEREPLWYPFFLTILDLGLRKGEAMALTYNDVDLKNNTIDIKRTRLYRKEKGELFNTVILDDPKTKASIRQLHMTQRLKEALLDQFEIFSDERKVVTLVTSNEIKEDDFIFRYSASQKYIGKTIRDRTTNGAFERIRLNAGLPKIKIHDLRHTHAVFMRESGAPLEDVQDTLGHSSIESTQIYAKTTPKIIERASKQYENYVNKKSN